MKPKFTYHFDWDPGKAAVNRRKHGVDFTTAMTVFADPLSLTCFDSGHSEAEERWVTIGQTESSSLVVVNHTFEEHKIDAARIRIISARPATKNEREQYEHNQFFVHEEKAMKSEYDFSGGERGKFFRKNAAFEIPVYLEPGVLSWFTARARERNIDVNDLLNEVLKRDIERMSAEK